MNPEVDFKMEDLICTAKTDAGKEYGLASRQGQIEFRYLTMIGVWAVARQVPEFIFVELTEKYVQLKVKEIADGTSKGT